MKTKSSSAPAIELFFDVISPFSYLLDAALRKAPIPGDLVLRPVLFAGLLQAYGNKGPAEIESKRIFTYEYCTWLARSMNIPFRVPPVHPFNPLRYLRLIISAGCSSSVTTAVFEQLWTTGVDPHSEDSWRALATKLHLADIDQRIEHPDVKSALRSNTEEAVSRGVFGVPAMICRGRLFWGHDSLPMLRDFIADHPVFESADMQAVRTSLVGATRAGSRNVL